jgi:hypothetical protein
MKLPPDIRTEVLASIKDLPTRATAIERVIKHFEDAAYQKGVGEGEKKARSAPAVLKQVQSQARRQAGPQPTLNGSGTQPGAPVDMNARLAHAAGVNRR